MGREERESRTQERKRKRSIGTDGVREENRDLVVSEMREMDLEKLRSVVRDCMCKHLYSSAIFFADKLATLAGNTPQDLFMHAQALYLGKEYRRALHLLRRFHLVSVDLRFRYLAAKCLAEVKDWEECLAMLGDGEVDEDGNVESAEEQGLDLSESKDVEEREIHVSSAMCLLRGRAFDALENRARALCWYKAALKADPFCYEAFEHLIDNHMLSTEQESKLLASLKFEPEDKWLSLLYSCRANKYVHGAKIEMKIAELEQEMDEPLTDDESRAVCSLKDNTDVMTCKADLEYHRGDFQRCYESTTALLEKDPYHLRCMPLHLGAALELGRKNELFLRAHSLVQEYPTKAISWFAVGCYYYCIRQYDHARRYFCKATAMENSFAPAWLGFGNAYAAQDESDQAMAAYRTAARLFAGCHLPNLCIGMEYLRTNNLNLAEQFLLQAKTICPDDPLVFNELGVMTYRNKEFKIAADWFDRALNLAPKPLTESWEPTVVNFAHTLRKLKMYAKAITEYEKALALYPRGASTYAALGFTYHLQGNSSLAIDYYHKALGLKPDDSFTSEMLSVALQDECISQSSSGGLRLSSALGFPHRVIVTVSLIGSCGSKWSALRQTKNVSRLGRSTDQRRAFLRGLTTE
ncbi:hypothetical protein R1flu_000369 [Riccia fluitans]|uniref:Anaphase-promoting complex subunit 6 n=1 Tax=Riccia fluitans TaxID=41844 RepID=A0ABD1Y4F8_9MARC